MLKLNQLPSINLECLASDVTSCLDDHQIAFKAFDEAPKLVKILSKIFNEPYLALGNTIYVPDDHVVLVSSENTTYRIIATSKLLPWVYAIKNESVKSMLSLFKMLSNTEVRCYYFLFEYALLRSHDLNASVSDDITTGFISTRKTWLGFKKDPEEVLQVLKNTLAQKVKSTD